MERFYFDIFTQVKYFLLKQSHLPIYQSRSIFCSIFIIQIKNMMQLKWPKSWKQQWRMKKMAQNDDIKKETLIILVVNTSENLHTHPQI
jgi:hypothetical protein